MLSHEELRKNLRRIDGKGYKAYKDIKESYLFDDFTLFIDHVQGDPFAAPSRIRVQVDTGKAGFSQSLWNNKIKKIALQDYLIRQFHKILGKIVKGHRGIGKSGLITVDCGGQEILERSAAEINAKWVEIRFVVGLPAQGRTISGKEAIDVFFTEIPQVVVQSMYLKNLAEDELKTHIQLAEDQEYLRNILKEKGLISFVSNNAILPRRSGIDDRPMLSGKVIPFQSPPDLEIELNLPNHGKIKGMGIPQGVTLIVGGGFHGKSTLLNAIELGVYNHIPSDGRDFVITDSRAVKIRAEDGRNIEKINISPFINNLPLNKDTKQFSTENASGSTSQAANILEALEVGAKIFLIDEDTSATNFMIRDERMQKLVSKDKEPITPFIDKVQKLYQDLGVSTILVMGGSGDYFGVADTVIMMDTYQPRQVTQKAKEIAQKHITKRLDEGGKSFGSIIHRQPLPESFDPKRGKRDVKIDAQGLKTILYGKTLIDLFHLEQLVDTSQTRSIGLLIHYYSQKYLKSGMNLQQGLTQVMRDIEEKGLDIISPFKVGDLALPRIYELSAAINRMRSLKIK